MKKVKKQSGKRAAFTIVELLTVMSIIIILVGLLVPALNRVRRYARTVKQKAQFHGIDVAMNLFHAENDGYPDSGQFGTDNMEYCGAMKLCEALMGQDLLGFNPASNFRSDLWPDAGMTTNSELYPGETPGTAAPPLPYPQWYLDNLNNRKSYIQAENASAYRLRHLYGTPASPFTADTSERFVLCDVYERMAPKLRQQGNETPPGGKAGMPILYYKANPSGLTHDANLVQPGSGPTQNIYDYRDNDDLVSLPLPWAAGFYNPMSSVSGPTMQGGISKGKPLFYQMTQNKQITSSVRPYSADAYILWSAGYDGMYGSSDDVFSFER